MDTYNKQNWTDLAHFQLQLLRHSTYSEFL